MSWNEWPFGFLAPKGGKEPVTCNSDYVLKAKMVTFWEVFCVIAGNALFARKGAFLREFMFLRGILAFWVKSCTFAVLGPQKTSQKLVFIKGFEQGARKVAFGAKKCTLGPRIAISCKYCYFRCQWLEKASDSCFLCPDHGILQGIPTFRESAKWLFLRNSQHFT